MIARILASNAGTAFVIMLALVVLVYVGVTCAAWTINGSPKPRRSWHWRTRNKTLVPELPKQKPTNHLTQRITYPNKLPRIIK